MPRGFSAAALAVAALVSIALAAGAAAERPAPEAAGGAAVAGGRVARRPHIVNDRIPYGPARRREMGAYSKRHYGHRAWHLRHPAVIVLHFTGGGSYSSAWNTFASNAPSLGELPGVCAHYIVGKDGTIHQLVSVSVRCRHAIGLNHRALGVEMVQQTGTGSHWADARILGRGPQIRAALRLVRYLRARFKIKLHNVIGHAMANSSPLFKDLEGWRNTHTDWLRRDVHIFRQRLARIS